MMLYALFVCGITAASPSESVSCPSPWLDNPGMILNGPTAYLNPPIGTFDNLAACENLKSQIEAQVKNGRRTVAICLQKDTSTWEPAH